MTELFHLTLSQFVQAAGYTGIFGIVLSESGLPFGFIFPGDSLLFAAGLIASQGYFDIVLLISVISLAAILGDSIGYWFGKRVGPHIFSKEDSFWFSKKNLTRTEEFYSKYGSRAIILARFVPVVRTFVPIFAGVGCMPYTKFLSYNVVGGLLWGAGVTALGYFLGSIIPNAEKYLLPMVAVVIILSFLPIVFEVLNARKNTKS